MVGGDGSDIDGDLGGANGDRQDDVNGLGVSGSDGTDSEDGNGNGLIDVDGDRTDGDGDGSNGIGIWDGTGDFGWTDGSESGTDSNSTDGVNGTYSSGDGLDFMGGAGNGTNDTDKGIILPPVFAKDAEEYQTEDGGNRMAMAVGIPLIVGLLIGLLLYKKQRRTMTASEYNEMMASDYVIVGTGDPPGSFHEGLYHYTKGGLRYLSTNCENCLETRRNTFYTDSGLPTILENDVYQDNNRDREFVGVVSPDSKDLGSRHLGIDVHRCTSSTCVRCNNTHRHNTVNFISSTEKTRASMRNQDFAMTQEEANAHRDYISDESSSSEGSV